MKRGLAVAIALASVCFTAQARAEGLDDDADFGGGPTLTAVTGSGDQVSRPITRVQWEPLPAVPVPAVVNSHVLYLNRCANGCSIRNDGSGTDATKSPKRSSIAGACTNQGGNGGNFVLSKFSDGDASWNAVVSCVKRIMSPFNITVTETDPGSAPHFEVMIGGNPGDIGCDNGVGGIANFPQSGNYVPNALVFDFSNVWQGDTNTICGTAAQEIAHAWFLDHTIDAGDPMTYKNYTGNLAYKNNEKCGSDCVGGMGPFGQTCTGDGLTGTHVCVENNQSTQDEVTTITGLFGPNNAKAPVLTITSPANGATVKAGFTVTATCTSTDSATVQEVDLTIDGKADGMTLQPPYSLVAPTNLTKASHKVDVTCVTSSQASTTQEITVTVGDGCMVASDCPNATDVCVSGSCDAGSGANGGLGFDCMNNTECASGMCLSDGTSQHCVVPCDETMPSSCPSGFGCIDGGGTGVCWPGADAGGGGGGGCDTGGGNTGPILLGLGFAAFVVTRKRR